MERTYQEFTRLFTVHGKGKRLHWRAKEVFGTSDIEQAFGKWVEDGKRMEALRDRINRLEERLIEMGVIRKRSKTTNSRYYVLIAGNFDTYEVRFSDHVHPIGGIWDSHQIDLCAFPQRVEEVERIIDSM